MKKFLRRLILGPKCNSESYIDYLRKLGMSIGENCNIYVPQKTSIDITRPYMISIGNNVQITEGVTILTHGYDWSVLKGVYGTVLGSCGSVYIGNNVFIGMNTTILKGVRIGNNVIIGANSLVNKDVPDNVVVAGNPCRIIMPLDKYYEKRIKEQEIEAKELVKRYHAVYGNNPSRNELNEFFWLFCDSNEELPEPFEKMMRLGGNYEFSNDTFSKHEKKYQSYEAFLRSIDSEDGE